MHTKEYKHKGKQHGKYSQNKKKLNPLSKIGKYHIVLSVIQKCTGQINALTEMTKQQHKTESDQENSEEMKDYADIAKSEVFCCRSFQNSASKTQHAPKLQPVKFGLTISNLTSLNKH